jgi:hypothetical protein
MRRVRWLAGSQYRKFGCKSLEYDSFYTGHVPQVEFPVTDWEEWHLETRECEGPRRDNHDPPMRDRPRAY